MTKIVKRKLSELRVYPNNPRHNQKAIPKVKESIKKYGYKVFIVIDNENFIIAGHTRHAALLQLVDENYNYGEIDCVLADDLTQEQINEFRIVDNLTATNAEWDLSALKIELELLPNLNISDFGEVPQLTVEDIQIQEEQKLELSDKIVIKIGSDKIEISETEYHDWVTYVIGTHNMSVVEFVRKQLHLDEIDREYRILEI